jgi:hypothetical protein
MANSCLPAHSVRASAASIAVASRPTGQIVTEETLARSVEDHSRSSSSHCGQSYRSRFRTCRLERDGGRAVLRALVSIPL